MEEKKKKKNRLVESTKVNNTKYENNVTVRASETCGTV